MYRYCENCKKRFEFEIKSIVQLEELTCPQCGLPIGKGDRPIRENETDQAEQVIRKAVGIYVYFTYFIYLVCSIVGVAAYCLECNMLLYLVTTVATGLYMFQYGNREFGFVWMPISAVVGFLIWKSLAGVCLGIMIALMIRHFLRRILLEIVRWFIHVGNQ